MFSVGDTVTGVTGGVGDGVGKIGKGDVFGGVYSVGSGVRLLVSLIPSLRLAVLTIIIGR